jgi:hypothetical protein
MTGDACIFVNSNLTCSEVNIQKYCTDDDIEACALKIYLNKTALYILTVYRSPVGDFKKFTENLDNILIFLTNTITEVIVCSDINVNYLINNNKKYQLNSILNSFNLFDIVDFPTQNASSIIHNIFVDYNRLEDYSIALVYNISDHNGQFLTKYTCSNINKHINRQIIKKINQTTLHELSFRLSFEYWKDIVNEVDVNNMFNKFLNIFLISFNGTIQEKKIIKNQEKKNTKWITPSITALCEIKKALYLLNQRQSHQI